ncbi:MAG TPA: hemerythrin domain-containing protein [Burkholderiaceae bacterium]|nr:hemerythrin domain-containing protein [Burkholderiaceae bacterium]
MTSPLTLHAGPAASFDAPFEMLAACHQRVARMLDLLARLGAHLSAKGNEDAARQAARDVMRYFDLAGPAHHEDEERHVFPVLDAVPDPAVQALVARLRHEHLAMAALWQAVRADLARVACGAWQADPASAARWDAFAVLYRQHIAAEESLAYPAAQPRLDGLAQAAMGLEMARRRGAR